VGDANGRSLLTHDGKYQARIAGDVIGGIDIHAYGDVMASPRVVFTDPNVAAVGLTEAAATEKGLNVKTVEYGFGWTAGAATFAEGIEGKVRIVVDEDSRTIVGATFVGPGSGEMLHAATIAIVSKITLDDLWHATPAFPTISEFWLRLLEAYGL
jgi:dihydrolipoamide dehydrogenase